MATWCTFKAKLGKQKNPLWNSFLHFSKEKNSFILRMKFSDPKIKKALIFSQKNVFHIFWKNELSCPKIKKSQKRAFRAQTTPKTTKKPTKTNNNNNNKTLWKVMFQEMELSSLKLWNSHFFLNKKKFLYIKSELQKPKKHFLYFLKKRCLFYVNNIFKCF